MPFGGKDLYKYTTHRVSPGGALPIPPLLRIRQLQVSARNQAEELTAQF